ADRAANQRGPVINDSFSIRQDEDLYQLEEATALIAASLSKVSDRVGTLAINSFYFGKDVDPDFRRKAEVIILDKVFAANPDVLLVQCAECQKLDTKIVNGVLKLRKGIPNAEARRELAKKLNADGFIDIGMFRDNKQITVYLKVTDAESGAIILVDELVGRVAAKRQSLTFSFGEFNVPIKIGNKSVDHNTLAVGVNQSVQLTQRFSFGVDLILFADNNKTNPEPHLETVSGAVLSPLLYWDFFQLPASTTKLSAYFGIGKMLFPTAFHYPNFLRAGFQFVVGDRLVIVMGANNFVKSNIELTSAQQADLGVTEASVEGTAYEIRFGYRF
ncbi:MAG TPA: hypothetical protein VF678_01890, partial [bacterium]